MPNEGELVRNLFFILNLFFVTIVGANSLSEEVRDKILNQDLPEWALEQIDSDLKTIIPDHLTIQALDSTMSETSFGLLYLVRYQIIVVLIGSFLLIP